MSYKVGGAFSRPAARPFSAVDRVSLKVFPGETLALVGESGCGKTTTGRLLLRLVEPTSGRVFFEGRDLGLLGRSELRSLRKRMQIIFQDPYGSLNPRFTVRRTLAEPLRIHKSLSGKTLETTISCLLETVGLSPEHADRYPHEFSGGQRQRIAIARAISPGPSFLVADEPVSALDISIQGQIVKLLLGLKKNLGMAMLFISHDLSMVHSISDRVAVMYRGRVVELAETDELYQHPLHPYTRLLLESVLKPVTGEKLEYKEEEEKPSRPENGCVFSRRCCLADNDCWKQTPGLLEVKAGHWAACLRTTYGE